MPQQETPIKGIKQEFNRLSPQNILFGFNKNNQKCYLVELSEETKK